MRRAPDGSPQQGTETRGAPIESVSIIIIEIPKSHWGIAGTSAKDFGR